MKNIKNYNMEQLIPVLYGKDRVKRDVAIFSLQLINSNDVFGFSFKLCYSKDKMNGK
ncbi:hypothetical protein ACSPDP_001029 [Escherichia albertii]|uniref:hypothetical protein n=1 Tax=Escherichia albertii TaxID=208962 RepID=UPI0007226905|nr:hypothetical protein [Escherichia albertii]MCZ8773818.1 hypothetical protein [Escherichia albertii]WDC00833.1 hypothetical protein PS046_16340 [Escherichia albertii]BAT34326.1 predicted protein [Escherichia albertii]